MPNLDTQQGIPHKSDLPTRDGVLDRTRRLCTGLALGVAVLCNPTLATPMSPTDGKLTTETQTENPKFLEIYKLSNSKKPEDKARSEEMENELTDDEYTRYSIWLARKLEEALNKEQQANNSLARIKALRQVIRDLNSESGIILNSNTPERRTLNKQRADVIFAAVNDPDISMSLEDRKLYKIMAETLAVGGNIVAIKPSLLQTNQ